MAVAREQGSPLRFGPFEADLRAGLLRKHGIRIRLQEQPFQILALLLEHSGEVVTREEIQKKLWGDGTYVDFERGLNKAVNRLREALADSAETPKYIETLPKRGYRFLAPVERAAPAAVLAPVPDQSPRRSFRWYWVLGLVGIGAALLVYVTRRPPREQDTVVLADFENRTGDRAFDHTLKQALAIDLAESSTVRALPDQRVSDTLRLMRRKPDEPVTNGVAREVCQRTGCKAMIGGSVASLGSEYVIDLTAVNCHTGDVLAQQQIRVNRKEEVLDRLDRAAADLRQKLGESLSSIERTDRHLHNILSTSSLEAFEAYADGERMVLLGRSPLPFFQRAVELDPEFANALAGLGTVYSSMGDTSLASQYMQRAFELRDRVSDWERYTIATQYYLVTTGELERAVQACQVWVQRYPWDRTAHHRLALAYGKLGDWENSRAEFAKARQVGGDHPLDANMLARMDVGLDRLDEARVVIRDALSARPDHQRFHQRRYLLAFLDADQKGMDQEVDWGVRHPEAEDLRFTESETEAYFGRLAKAREMSRELIESARRREMKGRAAVLLAQAALRDALFGATVNGRQEAHEALSLSLGWDVQVLSALALASVGDVPEAAKLADQLGAEHSGSTLIQNYWLPSIRAEIARQSGDWAHAIESLRVAMKYELADTFFPAGSVIYPAYGRGMAYLRARQATGAMAEFQKILLHRGMVGNSPLGSLARLGVARAYALAGDRAGARKEYSDLLAIWKGADAGLLVLTEAKAEFTALP
jgi:DNA-binding winged helix-turn-helix (wHTH) protein/tetratricopeptide (TPR) repeat protein